MSRYEYSESEQVEPNCKEAKFFGPLHALATSQVL